MFPAIGGANVQIPQMNRTEQTLSDDQRSTITDTLSQFDPDNLSESDALSIVDTLSEAGIQPGKAMEELMADSGFDAKSIGDLAGIGQQGQQPPPPPPPSESSASVDMTEMVDYLETLLSETDGELSEDDKNGIYEKLMERFDLQEGESVINITV